MKTIRVDLSQKLGPIKPMNGVGGGPLSGHFTFDNSQYFKEAGIPFGRTHDIEYPFGSGEYVDIHCVFPNFDADVDDPASYNFIFTDEYLKAMVACGTKPFYRLGSTIEHQPIKRYIHPPKDFKKWGEICSHIVAHYNEGWANGFEMGIEYWEIWNEPDLIDRCWTGTEEEFIDLYLTAAPIIKNAHPNIKVGGCAFTHVQAPLAEKWLAAVKENGAPMDFFSWHGYISQPQQAKESSEYADMLLKKYGFEDAESIYDEWNYVLRWDNTIQKSIDLHKTAHCASFVAAVMATLQDTRTDKAMYYDVQMCMGGVWNGVFTQGRMQTHGEKMPVKAEKPYYALKAWNVLKKTGEQASLEADDGLYAVAAAGKKKVTLLVSNYSDNGKFGSGKVLPDVIKLDWGVELASASVWVTDGTGTERKLPFNGKELVLLPDSFAVIKATLK